MPGTQVQKAERWGISSQSVSKYQRGETLPSSELRERIADAGGPDPDSWDEPYEARPSNLALAPLGQLAPATSDDTASEAALLLAEIRRLRQDPNIEQLDIAARGRLMQSITAMVDKLGHHTGVKLTPRQIISSPHWSIVAERIIEALEPWPEAMRAVADAIEELEA